jgi:hypothetical protein
MPYPYLGKVFKFLLEEPVKYFKAFVKTKSSGYLLENYTFNSNRYHEWLSDHCSTIKSWIRFFKLGFYI